MPSEMTKERRCEIEDWVSGVEGTKEYPITGAYLRACLAEIDRLKALVAIAGEPEPPMQPTQTFSSISDCMLHIGGGRSFQCEACQCNVFKKDGPLENGEQPYKCNGCSARYLGLPSQTAAVIAAQENVE